MTTRLKYNVVPCDGKLKTANEFVSQIIKSAPEGIDELQIEVEDLFTPCKDKLNVVNKSFNGVQHSTISIH